jgi:ketosteroid isomerase-like protein
MGSAPLEIVRSLYAGWERGSFSSADWAHPDIEFERVGGPAAGSWKGLAAMAKAWRNLLGAWEDVRIEADEFRQLDDERVLVFAHWSGRGKTSGLELAQILTSGVNLFHVRDGRVARLIRYWDSERALADLGLPSKGTRRAYGRGAGTEKQRTSFHRRFRFARNAAAR